MDGVEVTVELQRAAGLSAVKAHDDRWGGGMVRRRPFDLEPFVGEHLTKPVENRAGIPRFAGNLNQLDDGADEALAVDELVEALREIGGEGHGMIKN
jgi:hypothetical protein